MGFLKADWIAFVGALEHEAGISGGTGGTDVAPVCIDIGGGEGRLRGLRALRRYHYVNLEIGCLPGVDVIGDAHALPFADGCADLVLSTNSLEHVVNAWAVTREMVRIMKPGAHAVILIPFLHPFHGDDVARYTAYGLRQLLKPLVVERIEAPSHLMTFAGVFLGVLFAKLGLQGMARLARDGMSLGDRLLSRLGLRFESWAHSYLVVASKPDR